MYDKTFLSIYFQNCLLKRSECFSKVLQNRAAGLLCSIWEQWLSLFHNGMIISLTKPFRYHYSWWMSYWSVPTITGSYLWGMSTSCYGSYFNKRPLHFAFGDPEHWSTLRGQFGHQPANNHYLWTGQLFIWRAYIHKIMNYFSVLSCTLEVPCWANYSNPSINELKILILLRAVFHWARKAAKSSV